MKTSKRVLSVFMAVVMVIMSVSAGFVAFAAEDPWQVLIESLQADGVKNAAWPGSAVQTGSDKDGHTEFRVTMEDPTGDIEKAAEAFWTVATSIAPNHTQTGQRDDKYTLLGVKNAVLATLQEKGVTGDDLSVANAALDAFTAYQNGRGEATGWTKPSVPNKRDYVFEIKRDITNVLMQYSSVEDIPDTLYTSVTYDWFHDGQGGGSFANYWRNIVLQSWTRTETNPETEIPAALKEFANYFTDKLLATDLESMTSDELVELAKNNRAAIDALGDLWGSDTIINHFFDKDAIQNFVIATENTRDNKLADEYAGAMKDIMDKYSKPAEMELADLKTVLNEMTDLFENFNACNEESRNAALTKYGLTAEAIAAYIASVNEEKEVIEITALKAEIDAKISGFPVPLDEYNNLDVINVYLEVSANLELIEKCTAAAIARVFGEEGTAYIHTFLDNIYAKISEKPEDKALADEIYESFKYFNELIREDVSSLPTEQLTVKFTEANSKLNDLKAKYGEETVAKLFGTKYEQVNGAVVSVYTVLADRLADQISEIADSYDKYTEVNLLNHNIVEEAMGGVETVIWDTIKDTEYVSEELRSDYEHYEFMLTSLEEYNANPFDHYYKTEMEYPERDPMAGDVARTSDEVYKVTHDKLDTVISKLDSLMKNEDLGPVLGIEGTISDLIKNAVSDNLYTNEMVNTVLTSIYPMLVDTIKNIPPIDAVVTTITGQDILNQAKDNLHLMLYPNTLSTVITGDEYAAVRDALNAAGTDWNNLDTSKLDWGVHDKDSFVKAIGQVLNGFSPVLKAAFGNSDYKGSLKVSIATADVVVGHMDLYNNAILPLLELLECNGVVSTETFNSYTTADQMIKAILDPILDYVETVADAPISSITDILPKIAYVFDHDMITSVLKSTKLTAKATALGGLVNVDIISTAGITDPSLYGVVKFAAPDLDLSVLSDVNKLIPMVLGMVAPGTNLVLPTINQSVLASHGQMVAGVASGRTGGTRYQLVTDKADTLLAVLRYVLPMLGDNDFLNSVTALIGKLTGSEIVLSEDILKIINGIGLNSDNVICALTELFVPQEYASKELNYTHNSEEEIGQPINTVTYSADWTKEQAQFIADNTTDFVNDMMKILGGSNMPDLSGLIRSYIADEFYTNETINSVILMVKEQLDSLGMDLDPVLGLVGVDLSIWDDVTEDKDWGVIPGDTATFKAALKEALSPFAPIMATLMSGEADLTVLGAVTMKSYPGYQNGIIPILENLGCADEDIMSAAEYAELAKSGNYDQMISAIIDPILNLVDEIYADPINKVMDILPNAFYFINNGNLQICVENALQSVFVMLDTARPIYDLSFELNLNVQQILVDLVADLEVNGQKLNLKIPFLSDLSVLAVGNVTEYQSKSGKVAYKLTDADRADLVTVLMRNVVELIFYEDNLDAVITLVDSYVNMSDANKENLKKILYAFAETYHENNGVDKIMNAVYVIYKTMYVTGDGAVTIIGDFNERWSAVFNSLYNSGNPVLVEIAKTADEVLDFLSFGLINGNGIGTSGLIDFFDRVAAFFQGRVTDVSISQTSASLKEGESFTLSLSFKPVTVKNKNATWTTSNAGVATVENGVVKAVGPGDAEIKATTADGGLTVSCVVRVRADKTVLNDALRRAEEAPVDEALLSDEYINALATAQYVAGKELATQAEVNEAAQTLIDALNTLELGGKIESVTITQNGAPVGQTVYQKVPWTKKWNSTPAALGLSINEGAKVKNITWEYANWSTDKQEATIEAAADGMSALIRATNGVGARSAWIQVTVEDVYGNKVTSDPVKVRFYNYDWQK